jgi:hypothetical protein
MPTGRIDPDSLEDGGVSDKDRDRSQRQRDSADQRQTLELDGLAVGKIALKRK